MTWFLDEKTQKHIPEFEGIHLKHINGFHYFKEYNKYYDLINCIVLHIPFNLPINKQKFI